jgi:hypothetical protein
VIGNFIKRNARPCKFPEIGSLELSKTTRKGREEMAVNGLSNTRKLRLGAGTANMLVGKAGCHGKSLANHAKDGGFWIAVVSAGANPPIILMSSFGLALLAICRSSREC